MKEVGCVCELGGICYLGTGGLCSHSKIQILLESSFHINEGYCKPFYHIAVARHWVGGWREGEREMFFLEQL